MFPAAGKTHKMSPQLTLSSLFSVLALAGLCIVVNARDMAGYERPANHAAFEMQAEQVSGPHLG